METSYKGYEINQSSVDKRFRVYADGEAFIPCFNKDGYATLNNAKGAITKHLKAEADAAVIAAGNVVVNEDRQRAQIDAVAVEMTKKIKEQRAGAEPGVKSRNRREGRFSGVCGNRALRVVNFTGPVWSCPSVPSNRKQRKARKMASKGV